MSASVAYAPRRKAAAAARPAAAARRSAGVPLYLHRAAAGLIQRACLDATACAAPISGSAEVYSEESSSEEAGGRAYQRRRDPTAFDQGSHGGPARQVEIFAAAEDPALLGPVEGIFVDLALEASGMIQDCAEWAAENAPRGSRRRARLARAAKPCMWVPGSLNQQAYAYNRGEVPPDWSSREDWRIFALQTLTHEVRHVTFSSAGLAAPAGVACTFDDVSFELGELSALLSEFPIVVRPTRATGAGTAEADRLARWFEYAVRNPYASIAGMLESLGCICDCADVTAWVGATFDDATAGWSQEERDVFNDELRDPKWAADLDPMSWPL